MELREAIEEVKQYREMICSELPEGPLLTALQAIADGTLIPADQTQQPIAWLVDLDGTGSLHTASKGDPGAIPVYAAPAEQCFSVKEGYYGRMYKHSDNPALMYVTTVPLTEALEIRSADDVRREGYAEGYKDGFKKSGWEEMQRQTALIPAEQTEQCFSVREGYRVSSRLGAYMDVPLSEALEIRSADDVRREAFSETLDLFESRPDAVKVIRALIDTPQPKGGDDE